MDHYTKRITRQLGNIGRTVRSKGVKRFATEHVWLYINGKYVQKAIPFLLHNKEEWQTQNWTLDGKNHKVRMFTTNFNEYASSLNTLPAMEEDYRNLNVRGKIVVDVGANVGDSSIYFALKGAKKVLAIEPYPHMFNIARKNINANNLSKRVMLLQIGIGPKPGEIKINDEYVGTAGSVLKNFGSGRSIKITTLEDVIKKYKIKGGVLKMDIEGSEYDILLKANNNVLRAFSEIIFEYHYGKTDILARKLRSAGFKIKLITEPRLAYNKESENPFLDLGIIYAVK
jgi:FkbM family methyltransferase